MRMVRRWSIRTVDAERRAIRLGFLPGPRTRRRGSSCLERRFRIVPSARWQRIAVSRTVYQRSISFGFWMVMVLPNSAIPVPVKKFCIYRDLARPSYIPASASVTRIAQHCESVQIGLWSVR